MGQRASRVASWAAVLASPLAIIWLIAHFGVDVAVQDQIKIGAFLVRNHGRLIPSFADLFAQHNESRKFFPRLIFFYLAKLTQWDVRYEMAVSFAIACGIAVAIALLARRTLGDRWLPATALATLFVFSPVQWWNWLFGIQVVVFLPLLMLVAGLLFAEDRRFVLCALCCVVATYSYANGMLTWVLVGPALFVRRESRRPALIALWIAIAAAAIGAYFAGYHRPPQSPPLDVSRPFDLLSFALAFVGHPLAWSDVLAVNVVLGAIAVALFALGAIRTRNAAWTLLGLYSILSAGIAAAGRMGMGENLAVEPRYTTFAIALWIAIVMLWAIPVERRASSRLIGAGALIVLHILAIGAAWPKIREAYRDRLVAKTATQFVLVLPDRSLFQRLVEMDVPFAVRVVSDLAKIGYVNPPPVTSDIVQHLAARLPAEGAFEGVLQLGPGERVLYGWAKLPDGRPADTVLIARSAPDGDHVVALSERTVLRPDRPGMGWDLPLTRTFATPGTYTAWAYDASARRAYRLTGSVNAARRR